MSDNIKLIFCVLVVITLGFISGFMNQDALINWYPTLKKPFFQPPNWLFGPVWTVLYIMIGLSIGLILTKVRDAQMKSKAVKLFIFQFILNLLWTPVFFGLKNIALGAIVIVVLLWAIILTIRQFKKTYKASAYLLYPYLAWVSFATILNISILYLNP